MAPQTAKSGLLVGSNKGHIVTSCESAARPSARKGWYMVLYGVENKQEGAFEKSLMRKVAGFAPYEKRNTELLRVGKDKHALKITKRRLGTHKRAKEKRLMVPYL